MTEIPYPLTERVAPRKAFDVTKSHTLVLSEITTSDKADLHVGDLVYTTREYLVKRLNRHLEHSRYGPFLQISHVAVQLQSFKKKGKSSKFAELRGLLESFAASEGFDVRCFDEWEDVVWAKHRRDLIAYPPQFVHGDLTFIRHLIHDSESPIKSYAHAVDAMVKVAEKLASGVKPE